MNLFARVWGRLGGWLGIVDTLVHRPPLRWVVPQAWQQRICDRFDRKARAEFDTPPD